MRISFIFIILLIFNLSGAWAQSSPSQREPGEGAIVKKIIIKGQKKIEEAALRNKLVSQVGQKYSRKKLRDDVENLFNMGYFYNIVVSRKGHKSIELTYTITEKPSVLEIEYLGNNEVDDEELIETSGLKAYEILNMSQIREAIEKMEKHYEDKGYFLARIKHRLEPVKKGEGEGVKIIFDIQENDMVQVKKITILGNHHLSNTQIKTYLRTKEGGFFSFISGSGSYKQDVFDRDMQIINLLYFNEGFVQVKIDRPQVYVTSDKKGIFITFKIEEGEPFDIGSVDFVGDLLFSNEELLEAIEIDNTKTYSHEVLQKDIQALTIKYGDLGYAFSNVIPRTRIKEKDRIVDITFEFDKGHKVYIGEINVKGNSKTRDKVLRRELKIKEGQLYHKTRQQESLENIKRLGFFEEVNFHTKTPSGQLDRLDIDIVVKERNTGSIQVGAGYSSFDKFIFNGQVNQINFMGRGQRLGASIQYAESRQTYNLSFTEPYLLDTKWEAGFDIYLTERNLIEYQENKRGGALRLGHPLAPYLRGIIRYKLDATKLTLGNNGDSEIFPVETANGTTSSVTMSLIYDKRNDRFAPTKGLFTSASLEYAGLGGDLKYTKGLVSFRYYKKLFWDIVWRNNLNYGLINSNEDEKGPPFNELFLLGGANTLRGYEWYTVGRRKRSNKALSQLIGDPNADSLSMIPFGGKQQMYYNLEFQFPLITEAGVFGVTFYDIGYADDSLLLSDLRSNLGFGFRWYSPIGPLRFEWGFPFNRKKEFNEAPVNFHFAIGAPF